MHAESNMMDILISQSQKDKYYMNSIYMKYL
jgi:hypothetical protein